MSSNQAVGTCHSRSTSAGSGASPQSKFDENPTSFLSASPEPWVVTPQFSESSRPLPRSNPATFFIASTAEKDLFNQPDIACPESSGGIGLPPGLEAFAKVVHRTERSVPRNLPSAAGNCVGKFDLAAGVQNSAETGAPPPGLGAWRGADSLPFKLVCVSGASSVEAHSVVEERSCSWQCLKESLPSAIPPPPANRAPIFSSVEVPPPMGMAVVRELDRWRRAEDSSVPASVPPPPLEWAPFIGCIEGALPPPPPALMPALPPTEAAPSFSTLARTFGADDLVPGSCGIPTIGSAGHASGTCRPCAFVHTKGCVNGAQCSFCHLCTSEDKRRLKRDQRKQRRETDGLKGKAFAVPTSQGAEN